MHGAIIYYAVIIKVVGSESQYSKSCAIPELFYGNWEKGSHNCGLAKKYSHLLEEHSGSYDRGTLIYVCFLLVS